MPENPNEPIAPQLKSSADIVFCIDCTHSMTPCIEAVKKNVQEFASALQYAIPVDYRLRLIAYRDLDYGQEMESFDFTGSIEKFQKQVSNLQTIANNTVPESTLDAILWAAKSDWRTKCHKAIVVLTDAACHEKIHANTLKYFGLQCFSVQDLINFLIKERIILYLVAPQSPIYEILDQRTDHLVYYMVREGDGLGNADLSSLLKEIGKSISQSSAKQN